MDRTLGEIADLLECQLVGNPEQRIGNVADLESAQGADLAFFANKRYFNALLSTKAGAVIVSEVPDKPVGTNFLIHKNPSQALEKALELFRKPIESGFRGVHATAVIHASAQLGCDVWIGPHCTVDRDVVIGDRSVLSAGVYVGAESKIGQECHLHANAVVREGCTLGNYVIVQPNAVIGSCGFGFTSSAQGHEKQMHWGGVAIEDHVEIGALTAIDRARFTMTRIGIGTKIDNLVQIAHAVEIGTYNLVVAQAGFAGSCSTGQWVTLAGQSGVSGHVHLGDRVTLAARAGANKDILKPGFYAGFPATNLADWRRQIVSFKRLPSLYMKVQSIQERLELNS